MLSRAVKGLSLPPVGHAMQRLVYLCKPHAPQQLSTGWLWDRATRDRDSGGGAPRYPFKGCTVPFSSPSRCLLLPIVAGSAPLSLPSNTHREWRWLESLSDRGEEELLGRTASSRMCAYHDQRPDYVAPPAYILVQLLPPAPL